MAAGGGIAVGGGAFRRALGALPLVTRSAAESRIFRLAAGSLGAAVAGALALPLLGGAPARVLGDTVLRLLTVGFLGAVVVAMAFRLIPVLTGRGLRWPWLRHVALAALAGSVVLRTAELLPLTGLPASGLAVVASGVLAWVAFACVATSLLRALAPPSAPGN